MKHWASKKHMRNAVVVLEGRSLDPPLPLNLPTCSLRIIDCTNNTIKQIQDHLKDAAVVVASHTQPDERHLSERVAPRLKLVVYSAEIDEEKISEICKARNISVYNTYKMTEDFTTDHVIASYFALRRRLLPTHEVHQEGKPGPIDGFSQMEILADGETRERTLPPSSGTEVLGILGAGLLRHCITQLGKQLGMQIIWRGSTTHDSYPETRMSFSQMLKQATVLVVLEHEMHSRDMLGLNSLRSMRRDAVLISVSSSGVIKEEAVIDALKNEWISGAAIDQVDGPESCLLGPNSKGLNLITTPGVSCYGKVDDRRMRLITTRLIEYWHGECTVAKPGLKPGDSSSAFLGAFYRM